MGMWGLWAGIVKQPFGTAARLPSRAPLERGLGHPPAAVQGQRRTHEWLQPPRLTLPHTTSARLTTSNWWAPAAAHLLGVYPDAVWAAKAQLLPLVQSLVDARKLLGLWGGGGGLRDACDLYSQGSKPRGML